MKLLFLALFFLFPQILHAEDQTETSARDNAENEICYVAKDLTEVAKKMKKEREIESISGVKNLSKSRSLTERWLSLLGDFKSAQEEQEKVGGKIRVFHEDCEGISETDETVLNDELLRTMAAKGVKVSKEIQAEANELKKKAKKSK